MKIDIRNISFAYNSAGVLNDISMSVENGEFVCILGPNGSGKSTLMKCINNILKAKTGSILIDGTETAKLSQMDIAKKIGYIPQASNSRLSSNVFETVILGRRPYVNWKLSEKDREIALKAIQLMGIEDLAFRDFNRLSGGEQQKVIITRALAQEPAVLLIDEPTNNLDLKHQMEVLSLISGIKKGKDIAVLMAIHDLNLAARYADKVVMMKHGKIHCAGKPDDVLNRENIRDIFEVEVLINKISGITQIVTVNTTENA
ncbi:MAG: ABC transporter ATP-binding protein [Bacteroidales bacterium]|jgi:iron complex transport system ATP-binding protein